MPCPLSETVLPVPTRLLLLDPGHHLPKVRNRIHGAHVPQEPWVPGGPVWPVCLCGLCGMYGLSACTLLHECLPIRLITLCPWLSLRSWPWRCSSCLWVSSLALVNLHSLYTVREVEPSDHCSSSAIAPPITHALYPQPTPFKCGSDRSRRRLTTTTSCRTMPSRPCPQGRTRPWPLPSET
jgi:hypothetical protein